MLTIRRQAFDVPGRREGFQREVVTSVMGACDLCGAACESSREFDGDTYWSQAMAHQKTISAGFTEQMKGVLQQLICPACQKAEQSL